ncbi:hypothetical protein REPUB_Repub04eG0131300 [Reevesia pubescens]
MAMGGKGHGNGQRGRPYGLTLLLAFGVALLGVMALHKLRERRILNLLVEDKSRQLISLQLLLQKEREYAKEMKRKAEETKAKIYSLRNQKMELDRRLLEMQSTIDSLKEEQKTLESELEEKQNEIKLLRDNKDMMDSGNVNPQVIALTATLKQKEAVIEDLKHRLKSSIRVWSVSTDDPSNPQVNITVMGSMEQKEKTVFNNEEGGRVRVHESSAYKGNENSTKGQDGNETKFNFSQEEDNREGVEDGNEKKGEITLRRDMAGGGQLQKLESLGENARNDGATGEMKNEYSKYTSTSRIDGEKNHANATETIDGMDEQEKKISFTGQLGKLKNPNQEGEIQKVLRTHEAGKKLEIDDNSRISRLPERAGHLSRTKGKRWRFLARNRFLKKNVNSEIDGVKSIGSRRFSKEYKDAVRSRAEGAVFDEGKAEREETETGLTKDLDHTKANLFKHRNFEDTEDMKKRKVSAETNHHVEEEEAMSRNHDNSLAREIPENSGINGEASNYTYDAKQLKVEEATNTKQNMNRRDVKELEKKAELDSADRDGMGEDMEVADKQGPKKEAANGDISSDFMSDSEDEEGYKEETDESEF